MYVLASFYTHGSGPGMFTLARYARLRFYIYTHGLDPRMFTFRILASTHMALSGMCLIPPCSAKARNLLILQHPKTVSNTFLAADIEDKLHTSRILQYGYITME